MKLISSMLMFCFAFSNATSASDYDKLLDSIDAEKLKDSIDGTDIDYKKVLDAVDLDKIRLI